MVPRQHTRVFDGIVMAESAQPPPNCVWARPTDKTIPPARIPWVEALEDPRHRCLRSTPMTQTAMEE